MERCKPLLLTVAATAAISALAACGDRTFNPYLDRNVHRNAGQTAEAVAGAPGEAANAIDIRLEKTLY